MAELIYEIVFKELQCILNPDLLDHLHLLSHSYFTTTLQVTCLFLFQKWGSQGSVTLSNFAKATCLTHGRAFG